MIFRDGDVSWQIAAGTWILRHARIPTADPFSYTALGHPWVAMEWLAEVLYGAAYALDGYAGLASMVGACLIGLFAIIYFYLEQRTSPVALTVTLVMLAFVVAPFILVRPHVLAWPLLAAWTVVLLKAAETTRPPPIASTLLLVIWTNLHASFPLALIIEAAIAFDVIIRTGWSSARPWLTFGLISIVALMLNANGLAGLRQPFETTSLATLPYIAEWHASTTNSTPYFFVVVLLGTGSLLYTGARVPIGRLMLVLVLLWMALLHVRHQSFFMIVAACVLPPIAGRSRTSAPAPGWLLAGAVPLLAARAFIPLVPPEGPANPRSLIAAIPPNLRNSPVLNEYTFGGPLILHGIRPFIDGRTEIYGDAFVLSYFRVTAGDRRAFDNLVREYDIRWTMLSPDEAKLIRTIEASGEWCRLYADNFGVIDKRQPHPPSGSTACV